MFWNICITACFFPHGQLYEAFFQQYACDKVAVAVTECRQHNAKMIAW